MKKITKLAIVTSALSLNVYANTLADFHIGVSSAEV